VKESLDFVTARKGSHTVRVVHPALHNANLSDALVVGERVALAGRAQASAWPPTSPAATVRVLAGEPLRLLNGSSHIVYEVVRGLRVPTSGLGRCETTIGRAAIPLIVICQCAVARRVVAP